MSEEREVGRRDAARAAWVAAGERLDRSPAARAAVVLATALAAVVATFAPAWADLVEGRGGALAVFTGGGPDVLLGDHVDLLGTLWTFDHAVRVVTGEAAVVRQDMFAPIGFDTGAAQGYAWIDAVLALPLVAVMGIPDFYNVYIALLVGGTLVLGYAIFRRMGAPLFAALGLATALVVCDPMLREIYQGRPTQAHLPFHLLFLLLVHRLMGPAPRPLLHGALAGLALGAACLVYWFSGIGIGLLGCVAVLFHLAMTRHGRLRVVLGGAVLSAVAVLVPLVVGWRIFLPLVRGESLDAVPQGAMIDRGIRTLGDQWATIDLPLAVVALGLVVLPFRGAWPRVLPWALAGWALFSLPFGSFVQVGSQTVPTVMAVLQEVFPPIGRCHFPNRLVVVPMLAFAFAGAGAAAWLAETGRRRLAEGAGALLVGVSFLTADVEIKVRPAVEVLSQASFYEQVASRWEGGIIDVPLNLSNTEFVYQLVHRRQLLGGMGIESPTARPPAHVPYVSRNSFLQALVTLGYQGADAEVRYDQADREQLVTDGFGVVVVHPELPHARAEVYARLLGGEWVSDGARVAFPLRTANDGPPPQVATAPPAPIEGRAAPPAERLHGPTETKPAVGGVGPVNPHPSQLVEDGPRFPAHPTDAPVGSEIPAEGAPEVRVLGSGRPRPLVRPTTRHPDPDPDPDPPE